MLFVYFYSIIELSIASPRRAKAHGEIYPYFISSSTLVRTPGYQVTTSDLRSFLESKTHFPLNLGKYASP